MTRKEALEIMKKHMEGDKQSKEILLQALKVIMAFEIPGVS